VGKPCLWEDETHIKSDGCCKWIKIRHRESQITGVRWVMRAKALKFSIEGSEPGKGWITVVGRGFVEKARHSKITSTLLRFLRGLSV
jgi:hypothetical protein